MITWTRPCTRVVPLNWSLYTFLINNWTHFYKFCWRLIQDLVQIHTKIHYKITTSKDSIKHLITPCTPEQRKPTSLSSIMPSTCIWKCSWNILVTFCWFQWAKRVDRPQSWLLNSWSVRRVSLTSPFSALHKLRLCTSHICIVFKNTAKWLYNMVASKWHRIRMI